MNENQQPPRRRFPERTWREHFGWLEEGFDPALDKAWERHKEMGDLVVSRVSDPARRRLVQDIGSSEGFAKWQTTLKGFLIYRLHVLAGYERIHLVWLPKASGKDVKLIICKDASHEYEVQISENSASWLIWRLLETAARTIWEAEGHRDPLRNR